MPQPDDPTFGPVTVHRWQRNAGTKEPMPEFEYAQLVKTATDRMWDADCFTLTTVDAEGQARYLTVGRRASTWHLKAMMQATVEHCGRVRAGLS